jgi:hypothetical protein
MIADTFEQVPTKNALITTFVFVGMPVWVSYLLSGKLSRGHIHGSAIAIAAGRPLATNRRCE